MNKVIIHISDLHVTKGNDNASILTTATDKLDLQKAFIREISTAIKSKFNDENQEFYLLITGDIANVADTDEYGTASELMNVLIDELSIKKREDNIIVLPGDHDWNQADYRKAKDNLLIPNREKYKNFVYFYKMICDKDFCQDKYIFNKTCIGKDIMLLSLNSTLHLNTDGDSKVFIKNEQLRKELEEIKTNNPNKLLILTLHHNIHTKYDDKATGKWERENRGLIIQTFKDYEIRSIFYGNEHTPNSDQIIQDQDYSYYVSDAGTISSKNSQTQTFKCYELIENEGEVSFKNHYFLYHPTGDRDLVAGQWLCQDTQLYNEKNIFKLKVSNKSIETEQIISSGDDKTETGNSNGNVETYSIPPNKYSYAKENPDKSEQLYEIIKDKKLFHTGHFHWSETSRALNWVDTLKLIENKDDLLFIKNAIIDVMRGFQNHYKERNSSDLTYDLIIGLGYQGTMIATKATLQFNIPFSYLPYSYRNADHNLFERELNICKEKFEEKGYKTVVIVTDVVHSGGTISKLINEQQKTFFDNVENIFVISVIYTGKEEDVEQVTFSSDKIQFSYILNLEVAECPNKGKSKCKIEEDKLSDVLYFYTKK